MYDATLKIWVEGFKAFSKGRFIGDKGEFTIWDEERTDIGVTTKKRMIMEEVIDNIMEYIKKKD